MANGWLLVAEKGAPLNASEHDGNTIQTMNRILSLEGSLPEARGIASVTQVGSSTLRVTLQDGTFYDFQMPMASLRPRGTWLPNTVYNRADLFFVQNMGIYLVERTHTSGATFDPGILVDGQPAISNTFPVPPGPLHAPVLNINNTTHLIVPGNVGYYIRATNSGGCNFTFAEDSTVVIGSEIYFRQTTTGQVILTAGAGTVFSANDGFLHRTAGRGATIMAKKWALGNWDISGLLAAA